MIAFVLVGGVEGIAEVNEECIAVPLQVVFDKGIGELCTVEKIGHRHAN